ncbi:ATP synthase 6 kDa subunit, mitochondrial [Gossypium australe]|uniref:ATP synthase 6 kDa subunit, mitochondrial n=1 Tax=Gossypium australe TaxID=47621 RepID=A0A5B6X5W8_9ROSI|nr:ATP synthase 6 kDa subunit, mitochondrial [Gossypium australe]
MKRWFDPWPVFFKREFNRTWPFLVEEDAKNSPFAQKHKRAKHDINSFQHDICLQMLSQQRHPMDS